MEIINDKDNIKLVFDVIKNSQGAIFINCNSGKDRTGVICMLLLLLLLLLLLVKVPEKDL